MTFNSILMLARPVHNLAKALCIFMAFDIMEIMNKMNLIFINNLYYLREYIINISKSFVRSLSYLKKFLVIDNKDRICLGNYVYIDIYNTEKIIIYKSWDDYFSEIACINFNDFRKIINIFLDSDLCYHKTTIIRGILPKSADNTIIFSVRVLGDGRVKTVFERARDGQIYEANSNYEDIKKVIYIVCERFHFKMNESVMFRRQ